MSAADHLHPKQLAMLMPARELYGMHSMDTAGHGGDPGRMRASKRKANAASKIGRSVEAEGVRKPVQIYHGDDPQTERFMAGADVAVANGNHRVVAAYDTNPDMEIPVVHHDQFGELISSMQDQDRSDW
jgi:hypothetical protein